MAQLIWQNRTNNKKGFKPQMRYFKYDPILKMVNRVFFLEIPALFLDLYLYIYESTAYINVFKQIYHQHTEQEQLQTAISINANCVPINIS